MHADQASVAGLQPALRFDHVLPDPHALASIVDLEDRVPRANDVPIVTDASG